MNHRIGRVVFAAGVGLLVAWFSYQWITDPSGRESRQRQIAVVEASRGYVRALVANGTVEIVDPASPDRKVGKVYVFPEGENWSVSGYYRRGEDDRWHPYLLSLTAELDLVSLQVQDTDAELLERANLDPLVEASR